MIISDWSSCYIQVMMINLLSNFLSEVGNAEAIGCPAVWWIDWQNNCSSNGSWAIRNYWGHHNTSQTVVQYSQSHVSQSAPFFIAMYNRTNSPFTFALNWSCPHREALIFTTNSWLSFCWSEIGALSEWSITTIYSWTTAPWGYEK